MTICIATCAATLALLAQTFGSVPPQSTTADKPGTSTVSGRVVTADSGQPVRKAGVLLSPENFRDTRPTTTDADGAYEFTAIRAGRYQVSASKGGFIRVMYGQSRPNDPSKPLQILDHQFVEHLDFAL